MKRNKIRKRRFLSSLIGQVVDVTEKTGNTTRALFTDHFFRVTLQRDKWRRTPLHRAAKEGHKETVGALLESGAEVNAQVMGKPCGISTSNTLIGSGLISR